MVPWFAGHCRGCGRRCVVGEGQLRGACTCVDNSDCAIDRIPPRCTAIGFCDNPSTQRCTQDSECQPGDLCQDLAGAMRCITDFSSCNSNADCLCNAGSCFGTGRQCTGPADCALECIGGGCQLGASCGPDEGLLCPQLR